MEQPQIGPFVVAAIDLAETTDAYFSGAQAPSEVIVSAGAAIEPGAYLKADASGDVVTHINRDRHRSQNRREISRKRRRCTSNISRQPRDKIRIHLGVG